MTRLGLAFVLMTAIAVTWLLAVDNWYSWLNWLAYPFGALAFAVVMSAKVRMR